MLLNWQKNDFGVELIVCDITMDKEPNGVVSNILFFSANLFLYLVPVFIGLAIYSEYGAEPVAVLAFLAYLPVLGFRMAKIIKAIIKNEVK